MLREYHLSLNLIFFFFFLVRWLNKTSNRQFMPVRMVWVLNTAPEVRIRTLYWQLQVPSSRLGVFQEQKGAKVFTDTRVNKE